MATVAIGGAGLLIGCADSVGGTTWRWPGYVVWFVDAPARNHAPVYDDQRAYFQVLGRRVLAIDKKTGRVLWRADVPGHSDGFRGGAMAVAGDLVVSADGDLVALDRLTGATRWTFTPPGGDAFGVSNLAYDGANLYSASGFGHLYAIDAASGAARWQVRFPCDSGRIAGFGVALGAERVHATFRGVDGARCGGLATYGTRDGVLVWQRPFLPVRSGGGYGSVEAPIAVDDVVVTTALSGIVFGFLGSSGDTLWTLPPVHPGPDEPSGSYDDVRYLARAGQAVVSLSSTGLMLAVDPQTGGERWRAQVPQRQFATGPAGTQQDVLLSLTDGTLLRHDAGSGVELWARGGRDPFETGPTMSFWGRPAVDRDVIYVSSSSGPFALRRP